MIETVQGRRYTGPAPRCKICNAVARSAGKPRGKRRWMCPAGHGYWLEVNERKLKIRPPRCPECHGERRWDGTDAGPNGERIRRAYCTWCKSSRRVYGVTP